MSFASVKFPVRLSLVVAAGIAAGLVALGSGATVARAADAQWCLMRDGAQDCAYYTLAQCLASASGQGGQCDINSGYYDRAYAELRRPVVR